MKNRKKLIKKPLKNLQPLAKTERVDTMASSNNNSAHTEKKSSFARALEWFDDYILLIIAGFLFAFIPLYPKLPLADIMFMFLNFGDSIYERFLQLLQPYPAVMDTYDNLNASRKSLMAGNLGAAIKDFSGRVKFEVKPPEDGHAVTADEQENTHVLVSSDTRPATQPADVYVQVPDTVKVTTTSATGVTTTTTVEKERVYSANALKYGLSMAIRLDTLWPQAIRGFQRNPLVGSGYATLTKANVDDFTEAESTDNNFLRTLGETGLLGFITFYGPILIAIYLCGKILISSSSSFAKAIAIGFISGSIALLVNALYIDVYASSKIAFTYWALTGFVVAYFVRELAESKMRPQLPDNKVETVVLPKPKQ